MSSTFVQTIGIGSMASVIPPGTFEIRRAVVVTVYVVVSIFGSELHITKTTEKEMGNRECISHRLHTCLEKVVREFKEPR